MWKYLVGFALSGIVSAHILNTHLEKSATADTNQGTVEKPLAAKQVKVTEVSSGNGYAGRTAKIKMDSRGHFVTKARMNNRNVDVLVDTGATSVAINKSTARRLGIHLAKADFKYEVNTANGKTLAAVATIDRIEIGRVQVRDVRAAVLEDKALSTTLLGMSFLGELKGFEVKNKQLILTQ